MKQKKTNLTDILSCPGGSIESEKKSPIWFEADLWQSLLLSVRKSLCVVTKRIPPPPNVVLRDEGYSPHFRENKNYCISYRAEMCSPRGSIDCSIISAFRRKLEGNNVINHMQIEYSHCFPSFYRSTYIGIVVKTLRYKPAGRGFDSRWRHWNFSLT